MLRLDAHWTRSREVNGMLSSRLLAGDVDDDDNDNVDRHQEQNKKNWKKNKNEIMAACRARVIFFCVFRSFFYRIASEEERQCLPSPRSPSLIFFSLGVNSHMRPLITEINSFFAPCVDVRERYNNKNSGFFSSLNWPNEICANGERAYGMGPASMALLLNSC